MLASDNDLVCLTRDHEVVILLALSAAGILSILVTLLRLGLLFRITEFESSSLSRERRSKGWRGRYTIVIPVEWLWRGWQRARLADGLPRRGQLGERGLSTGCGPIGFCISLVELVGRLLGRFELANRDAWASPVRRGPSYFDLLGHSAQVRIDDLAVVEQYGRLCYGEKGQYAVVVRGICARPGGDG
jgi:hypothetical protein